MSMLRSTDGFSVLSEICHGPSPQTLGSHIKGKRRHHSTEYLVMISILHLILPLTSPARSQWDTIYCPNLRLLGKSRERERCRPLGAALVHPLCYKSFKWPVTLSTILLGAGPTPRTVRLPASICVRPASAMTSAVIPKLRATPMSCNRSSSPFVCTAILACPCFSQRWRRRASGFDEDFCAARTSDL